MSAHVHAKLMSDYAEDAAETDKPWERWEYCIGSEWFQCKEEHMHWSVVHQYRRKPRTININGHEVPEPIRQPLEYELLYYVPDLTCRDLYADFDWSDTSRDDRYLNQGIIHLTKKAAIAHAHALLSFTNKGIE